MSSVTYINQDVKENSGNERALRHTVSSLRDKKIFSTNDKNDDPIFGTLEQIIFEINEFGYRIDHVSSGDFNVEITTFDDNDEEYVWELKRPYISSYV